MFDFIGTILWPFKWLVSIILVGFHNFFSFIGIPEASGVNWTISIIGLVLIIRVCLIPVFVKQIKAQRGMQALQPEMKKLQAKYKGKTDQLSRQAMAQEQMALYKSHGTNPFSACLPLIIQMPFFFSLFQVLSGVSHASQSNQGIVALSADQVRQFDAAEIFGAKLSDVFLPQFQNGNTPNWSVVVFAAIMILAMIASQFITQRQIMAKNMTADAMASPFMKQQKLMLYVLPLVFGIGGINFPIGVLIYWTTTNLWTMGQQYFVIRRMPSPGTKAYQEYMERRKAKGLPILGASKKQAEEEPVVEAPKGQRQQPQRKNRKKK